jgi:hypothetical protein
MNDKSAAELEVDAEAARARVAETASSIRSKMSPGQLIDEFTGLFTGGDGASALNNLKGQIRDNPLPMALVGTGLAWLMMGGSGGAGSDMPSGERKFGSANGGAPRPRSAAGSESNWNGGNYSDDAATSGVVGSVKSATAGAADAAVQAMDYARTAVSDANGDIRDKAGEYAAAAGDLGQQARQSLQDVFQREPLVMAALGLAVGTAIGAMLPGTAIEDEQFGRYRDKLAGAAEDLIDKGVESAKEVAAGAYEAVKEEADKQGLGSTPDSSLVDQVGKVVKATAEKTEAAVRGKLSDEGSGA